MEKVAITGIGVISSIGHDTSSFWTNLVQGKSGADYITGYSTDQFKTKVACEIKNYSIPSLSQKEKKQISLFSQYGIHAANEAIEMSGIMSSYINPTDISVLLGSACGSVIDHEKNSILLHQGKPKKVSPWYIPGGMGNVAANYLTIKYGFMGLASMTTSACASSSHAIGIGSRLIQTGDAKVVVAGGCEAGITGLGIVGFENMKALSQRKTNPKSASRPFDIDRDGFVLGDGAGVVILEQYEHAIKRNANILATLNGFGFSSDANNMVVPSLEGTVISMNNALNDAKLNKDQIDCINAHGTSTQIGDINECQAINNLFGEHAKHIAVTANKSIFGHTVSAAGAMEAVASILSIQNKIIPPTINVDNQDPACNLDITPNTARDKEINYILSNSFGFGGTNGTLIFAAH